MGSGRVEGVEVVEVVEEVEKVWKCGCVEVGKRV